ncbi:MAG: YqeG family HAD IIIA-type phosphatase [Peptococcaceae bacterium]|jgi:HAD superfamily phosphatase (TIGR01668 family)|nr:YqeG family HAD IIIA-type phosphatase [Peptococcaceae bacterium]
MKRLDPRIRVDTLAQLDLKALRQKGFKGILIDLDNTISPWRQNRITEEARRFFREAKALDFKICLFTNAKPHRAVPVSQNLGIRCFPKAHKPFGVHYRAALREMELEASETLMIGDQIFTDIWGGNRAGCHTVLLPPLYPKNEFVGTKCLRVLERIFGYHQTIRRSGN